MLEPSQLHDVSETLMALLGSGRQTGPFSQTYPGFDLPAAYRVVNRVRDLRRGRGETPVGRKIGFTNRVIWTSLNISAPIWNYVFDSTLGELRSGTATARIDGMPEPRIEPEVVLHLRAAPEPGMSLTALFDCIDWVAPGFELVFSIFPDWNFTAADAAAAYGLHGQLFVGAPLQTRDRPQERLREISGLTVVLTGSDGTRREGHAGNVLGGPVEALMFLTRALAKSPDAEPLRAGEIVTTGTLTEAMPLGSGQRWEARFRGIDFEPIALATA